MLYCGQPERTPQQIRADRLAEVLQLVTRRPYERKAVPAADKISPNDKHKRFDFNGRARVLMGSADGISAAAPDDTLADHLYIAADPFSDLNPNFADYVADFDGVDEDEGMQEKEVVEEDSEELDEAWMQDAVITTRKGDHPDTLPEEALYLTSAQVSAAYAVPRQRRFP